MILVHHRVGGVVAHAAGPEQVNPTARQARRRAPHLLGVAGLRGGVVTVFSLETLLGLSATETPSFWLALAGGRDAFAFAFPVLDGFLRAPRAEVVKDGEDPAHNAAARTREYVSTGSLLRPIVDVDAMRETVNAHAGSTGNDRER